jgi:hypothetical protein
VVLPFLPFAAVLGLVPLAPSTLALLGLIVAAYLVSGEVVKRLFYRMAGRPAAGRTPSSALAGGAGWRRPRGARSGVL